MLADYILFWKQHYERPPLDYKEVMLPDGSIVPRFTFSVDFSEFYASTKQLHAALVSLGKAMQRARS